MRNDLDDDLTDIIESGLKSEFQRDYLEPVLNAEIERCKDFLSSCSIDDFVGVQAKVRTLKEILERPRRDYKDMKEVKNERERKFAS